MPSVAMASTKNVPRRLRWWLGWSFFYALRLSRLAGGTNTLAFA
jgi:hypothetical protein